MNYADDIRRAVPATELFSFYGFSANRAGFVCCPLHSEKTPSLKVYPGGKGWKCFGCGAGGSVIDFVMEYFRLSFSGACAKINEDFRLGLPIGKELSLRELRAAEKAAKERRWKIEAERAEHQRLLDDYHAALDRYIELDKQRIEYAPERTGGVLSDFYAEAVKNIPAAENALNEAEMRLYEYEHHRTGDN